MDSVDVYNGIVTTGEGGEDGGGGGAVLLLLLAEFLGGDGDQPE